MLAEPENKSSARAYIKYLGEYLFALVILSLLIGGPALATWTISTCLGFPPETIDSLTGFVLGGWIGFLISFSLYFGGEL